MKSRELSTYWHLRRVAALAFCLTALTCGINARAGDAAVLVSNSIPAGTQFLPRTAFTQTWTMQNTGTTTWTPDESGYTMNMVGTDYLAAVPFTANSSGTWYVVCCSINSGKSVDPGSNATFSMSFIAPEPSGSYTDTFQLSSASGDSFGPVVTTQITVEKWGSTNQFDRARTVSYANNYAGYVVTDGYFWTNGSDYVDFGAGADVPTAELGDDCAHFVSCCIGQEPHLRGGGIYIPSRVPPTYGEPAATRIVVTCLIDPGFATEVSSLNELEPGDVIGWNWEGDTNINDLDHVTLYLGNGVVASHAQSALDVSATTFFQSGEPDWVWHLIHIFDAPTITAKGTGTNLVLSWGTNWTGYTLYSSTSLNTNATWTKMSKSPTKVGALNMMTNSMTSNAVFYRLELP